MRLLCLPNVNRVAVGAIGVSDHLEADWGSPTFSRNARKIGLFGTRSALVDIRAEIAQTIASRAWFPYGLVGQHRRSSFDAL
jgi:hypothetical protein